MSAISSVPPFYFSFNMEEYIRYYEDLADAVDVPVLIYNIPAMSGIHFSKTDLERLLSNEKIIGIKHTSYDLFQLQQIIEEYPDKSVFIGHDELYLSALAVGVRAGIGSTFNIMAEKFLRMNKLFDEKRLEEALITPITIITEIKGFPDRRISVRGRLCGGSADAYMELYFKGRGSEGCPGSADRRADGYIFFIRIGAGTIFIHPDGSQQQHENADAQGTYAK
ncbi:dihydrodipicolinate synthase family protein [Diplocloster hominis]|uniref:dihydrodipicolinate synthase family protein n=1 Tax=Diplocloster hominis TaxID=3079010 RepID=UPI0031B9B44A